MKCAWCIWLAGGSEVLLWNPGWLAWILIWGFLVIWAPWCRFRLILKHLCYAYQLQLVSLYYHLVIMTTWVGERGDLVPVHKYWNFFIEIFSCSDQLIHSYLMLCCTFMTINIFWFWFWFYQRLHRLFHKKQANVCWYHFRWPSMATRLAELMCYHAHK